MGPKKLLRIGLESLAGISIGQLTGQYILRRHAFSGQGFSAFQWNRLMLQVLETTCLLTCVWLFGRRGEKTT